MDKHADKDRGAAKGLRTRKKTTSRSAHLKHVLLAIRNINQLIVHEEDPQRLIERACGTLTGTLGYHNAWIALLAGNGRSVVATAATGFAGKSDALRERLARGDFSFCMRQALEKDATFVMNDKSAECSDCLLACDFDGRAVFTRRLAFGGGTYGILAVSVPATHAHDAEELSLFDEMAGNLGFALHKIELLGRHIQNEERLRLALKATNDVVWDWDIVNDSQRWNESGTAVFGWTDIVEAPQTSAWWVDRVHPEDRQRVDQTFFAAVNAPAVNRWNDEYRFRKADGTYAVVVDRGYILRAADGRAVRMIGAMLNITERKRVEETLRESEKLLSRAQEIAHTGSWKLDLTTNHLTWSDEVYRIFGCKPQEFAATYEAFLNFVHPDDRAAVDAAYSRSQREGNDGYEIEHRIVRLHSGEVRHVHERCVHERDAAGTIIQSTGMVQDVTEQNRAKAELEFQSNLLQNIRDLVVATDLEGRISYVNNAACVGHGLTRDELIGANVLVLGDDPLLGATQEEIVRRTREEGQWQGEIVNLGANGARMLLECRVQLLRDATGAPYGMVGTSTDITDRKHAEEERAKLQAQFLQAQKMESVGRLAGGVAHDFNNLLMGILGYTDLCRERVPRDHPIQEWLDEITTEAQRSVSLVRQLLAFARKQIVQPKALDLNDQIGGMLKLLGRLIGERINLIWSPAASLRIVNADPSHVDQVMANLCVNAADAIAGSGSISITTRNEAMDETACAGLPGMVPGAYVLLSVADTGCGMDADTVSHLFEPFFTTKGVGRGTGLGLATVYGIVKQSGGFIYVHSIPGAGTTFNIYLPAMECPGMETVHPVDAGPPPGGSETILVVDDERSIRVTTSAQLERLGYNVLMADGPETALRLARVHAGSIDLLLSDMVMPCMGGVELRDRLRSDRPGLKTIFITGYTTADFVETEGKEADTMRLTKPVPIRDLAIAIRSVLSN